MCYKLFRNGKKTILMYSASNCATSFLFKKQISPKLFENYISLQYKQSFSLKRKTRTENNNTLYIATVVFELNIQVLSTQNIRFEKNEEKSYGNITVSCTVFELDNSRVTRFAVSDDIHYATRVEQFYPEYTAY